MPHRPLALMLVLGLGAVPAAAQQVPGADLDPEGCTAFLGHDMPGRIAILTTIEPYGDDIDPEDEEAAQQWANEVADVCLKDPKATVSSAAQSALITP